MKFVIIILLAIVLVQAFSLPDLSSFKMRSQREESPEFIEEEEDEFVDDSEIDDEMVELRFNKTLRMEKTWVYKNKKSDRVLISDSLIIEFGKGNKFICYQGSAPSTECQEKCNLSPKHCNGDKKFRRKFNCSKQDDQCYCKTVKSTENIIELESSEESNATQELIPFEIPANVPRVVPFNGRILDFTSQKSKTKRDVSGITCDISIDQQVLDIVINPPTLVTVHVSKGKFKTSFEMTNFFSQRLPLEVFMSSDYVSVIVLKDGEAVKYVDLYVIGEKICRMRDCIMCWDAYSNFKCMPRAQQFVFVVMIMALSIMLLAFMPVTVYILAALIQVLWFPIKITFKILKGCATSKMSKDMWSFIKDKSKKTKDYALVQSAEEGRASPKNPNKDQDEEDQTEQKVFRLSFRPRGPSTLLLVAFFFVIGANACTSGLFVSSTFNNCVRFSETEERCDVISQLSFTLQTIGAESCFTIQNNGSTVGTVNIKFLSEYVYVSTSADYATGCWRGCYQSVRKCAEKSSCPESCDPSYPGKYVGSRENPPRNDGPIDDPCVLSWPGYTTCSRGGSGCSWNGCDSCANPCVFSSYGIVPSNEAWVMSIASQTRQPKVEIESCDQFSVCSKTIVDILGLVTPTTYGKVQIIGSLSGKIIDFGNKKFIVRDNNNVWLKEASPVGGPIAGSIGDIQSSSPQKLMSANPNAFTFDRNIVTLSHRERSDDYTFKTPGCTQLDDSSKLPLSYSGETWYMSSNGYISSDLKSAGALLGTFEISGELKFSRTVNEVCPRIQSTTQSGCYNCSAGSTIILSARSVCMSGIAQVSIRNSQSVILLTPSIALTNSWKDFVISIQTNVAVNNFDLMIQSGSNNVSTTISFVAIPYVEITQPNNTDNPGNGTKDTGGGGGFEIGDLFKSPFKAIGEFFKDLASGKLSWWLILLFVGLVVVALIVIAVIVVPLIFQFAPLISTFAQGASIYLRSKFPAKKTKTV